MRVSAKKVIEAMREVRLANKEITTHNIAGQLGIKVQTVGANLQKMLKEGLIRRHGMVLQFEGNNRAKNMLWRINTLYVRKLEAEASAANDKNEEADGSTGSMHDVQGSQAAKRVPQDQVQNAGQLVQ
jgi:Mn-dependent DtxR family transcriptional regulator